MGNVRYEIIRFDVDEYRVMKYSDGVLECAYAVKTAYEVGSFLTCTCIAGKIHGRCKHMMWVAGIYTNKNNNMFGKLPVNVKLISAGEKEKQEALKAIKEMQEHKRLERSKK